MQRLHALDRIGCAAPIVARERLGELSLFVEVRVGGKRADETPGASIWRFMGQDRPLSLCPVSTRRAERRSLCGVQYSFRWEIPFPWTGCVLIASSL